MESMMSIQVFLLIPKIMKVWSLQSLSHRHQDQYQNQVSSIRTLKWLFFTDNQLFTVFFYKTDRQPPKYE